MKVKFGDIVRDVKENVDRSNNPYEFYVAGDHMDSEDFRIRRRGSFATDDVGPAFVRIFRPGQILYGSRRTYLKKVCVADFEGVTANTTFVLETKDEKVLLQKLLPFLMLSKGFTDWSVKRSKGSTNPYVLFSDLAAYEFSLPPLAEQKKLAELLWAANDLKEAYKKMIAATDEMLKAKFREMFGDIRKDEKGFQLKPLIDVVTLQRGFDLPEKKRNTKGAIPVYGSNGVLGLHDTFAIDYPTVITGRSGTIGQVYVSMNPCWPLNTTLFATDNHGNDIEYLAYFLREFDLEKYSNGTGVPTLNRNEVHKVDVIAPPLALQQEFVEIARKAEEAKAALKKSIGDVEQVIKGLING